ncbi:tape measure protein, partial [Escherichia coli]
MAQFKVDDFLIELGFNSQRVLKGLEKAEKQTMQVASRIEKRLNKAFKVNPTPLNDSLKVMERNVDKTVSKIEQRLKNTKAFKIKTEIEDTLKPLKQPRQPRVNTGDRAVRAAYQANMSKLKGFDPILQKYIKSQFYGLSAKAGSMDSSKFNEKLAQLNASVREAIAKARGHTSTSINNTSDAFNNLASNAIKLSGAFYSVMGALNAYKAIMNAGLKRDSAQRAAKFVLGDKASEAETFIRGLADKTGLNISEGLSSYAKFAAGAQGSMSQEQTQELFGNATAMSRLMGLSNDELNGILKAFEQMASKGKIQAEELRGQLGDRMAGAFKLFAEALGMTATELDKAMKDGKILSSDTLPKVAKQMGLMIDKAGGWAEVAKSTQTALGKLANNWDDTMVKIFSGSQDE